MSKLRRADYTAPLKGKTIEQVYWNSEGEDFTCLILTFADSTVATFRLRVSLDEEVELSDFKDGNVSNEQVLTPLPIPTKPKEGE